MTSDLFFRSILKCTPQLEPSLRLPRTEIQQHSCWGEGIDDPLIKIQPEYRKGGSVQFGLPDTPARLGEKEAMAQPYRLLREDAYQTHLIYFSH